jgi:hypothetical protein
MKRRGFEGFGAFIGEANIVRFLFIPLFAFLATISGAFAQANPCALYVFDSTDWTPMWTTLNFTSASDVSTYFGSDNELTTIATDWWKNGGYGSCNGGSLSLTTSRIPVTEARARIFGGNLASSYRRGLTATGAVEVYEFGDFTWDSSNVTLKSGPDEYSVLGADAAALQNAINNGSGGTNSNLPSAGGSGNPMSTGTLRLVSCTFAGYVNYINLHVTGWGSGSTACGSNGIPLGAQLCDGAFSNSTGCTSQNKLTVQEQLIDAVGYATDTGTRNPAQTADVATFAMFLRQSNPTMKTPETITAYWEQLTTTAPLEAGAASLQIQDYGAGGGTITASNCSGWGPRVRVGSQYEYVVVCQTPVISESASASAPWTFTACQIQVKAYIPTAGVSGRAYMDVSGNNYCQAGGGSIGYMYNVGTGQVATQLKLTQDLAWADSPSYDVHVSSCCGGYNSYFAEFMSKVDIGDAGYTVWQYRPFEGASSSNYEGGPAMPNGLDPNTASWARGIGVGYLGEENCGGQTPTGGPTSTCPGN